MFFYCCCLWLFETRCHCVAQAGFKSMILLPQPPDCWKYRFATPCSDLLSQPGLNSLLHIYCQLLFLFSSLKAFNAAVLSRERSRWGKCEENELLGSFLEQLFFKVCTRTMSLPPNRETAQEIILILIGIARRWQSLPAWWCWFHFHLQEERWGN